MPANGRWDLIRRLKVKHRSVIVPRSPLFMNPRISAGCHSTAFYLHSLTADAGCCYTQQRQDFICKLFIFACRSVCLWPFIRVVQKKVIIQSVHPNLTKVSLVAVICPVLYPYFRQCTQPPIQWVPALFPRGTAAGA